MSSSSDDDWLVPSRLRGGAVQHRAGVASTPRGPTARAPAVGAALDESSGSDDDGLSPALLATKRKQQNPSAPRGAPSQRIPTASSPRPTPATGRARPPPPPEPPALRTGSRLAALAKDADPPRRRSSSSSSDEDPGFSVSGLMAMWQRKAAAAPAAPLRPATNTDPVGPNRGAARGGPSAEAARTGRQGLASSSSSDASADRDAASRSRRGQGLGQSRMVTPQTSMRRGSTAASAQGSASAFAAASAQGEALRARGSSRSLAVPEELDLDRPASSSSSDAPTLRSAAARQASVSSRQQPSVPVSRASSFRQSEQQAKQQRPSSPLHRAGSNMQPQQEPRSPSASPGAKSSETSVSPRRLGAQTSFRRDSMRVLDTDSELEVAPSPGSRRLMHSASVPAARSGSSLGAGQEAPSREAFRREDRVGRAADSSAGGRQSPVTRQDSRRSGSATEPGAHSPRSSLAGRGLGSELGSPTRPPVSRSHSSLSPRSPGALASVPELRPAASSPVGRIPSSRALGVPAASPTASPAASPRPSLSQGPTRRGSAGQTVSWGESLSPHAHALPTMPDFQQASSSHTSPRQQDRAQHSPRSEQPELVPARSSPTSAAPSWERSWAGSGSLGGYHHTTSVHGTGASAGLGPSGSPSRSWSPRSSLGPGAAATALRPVRDTATSPGRPPSPVQTRQEEQWHQRQILVGRQVAAETAATAAAAAAGLAGVSPAMAWRMGGAVPSPAPVRLGAHSRTLVLSDGGASEAAGESPGSPPLAEDSDGMGFSGGAVSDGAGVDGSSPSHSQRLDYLPPITHITQQLEQLLQHVNALGLGADSPTRGGAGGGGGWSGGLSPGGVALFPGAATEARPLAPAAGRATPGSPDRLVPTAAAGLGTSPAAPAQSPPRPFPFSPGGSGADVPALLRQLSTLQREVDQLRRTVLLERATGALGPGSGTGAGPGAALSPRTRAALAASALVGPTNVSPVGSGSPGAGRPRSSPGSPHELSANASSLSLRPGASSGGGSTGMAGAGSGRGVANIAPPRGLVLTHPSSAATTAAAIAPLTQRRSVSPSLPAGRLPARIEPLTLATQRGRSASPSSPHMYGPAATPHTLLTDRGRFLGTQLPSDPNHSVGGQDPNQVRSIMAALDSIRGSLTALGDSVEEVQGMMDPESGSPSGSRLASGSGRRARSTSPRSGGRPLSPIRITGRFYGRYSGGGTGDLEGGPSSASLALAEAAAEATAGELPGAAGSPVASPRRGRYDGGFDGSGRGSSRPSSASPRFRGGLSGRVGLVGGGGLGPGAGEVGFTSSTRRLVAALDETVSRLEAVAAEQPAWQAPASPAGRERALAAGVGNVSFGGGAGGWIGGGGVGRTAGAVVSPVASPSVVRMLSMTPAAHPSPPRAVGYSAAGRGGLPAPPASTVPTWDRFSDQGPGALAFAPSSLRGGPLAVPSPVAGLVAATGRPSGRTTVRVVDSPTRRNALSGRGSSPPGSPHTRAQPRSPPLDAYPDAPAPVTAMAAAMLPGGRLLLMDGLSPPHSPAGSRPGSPHRTARPRSPAAASAAAAAAAPGGDGMAGLTANVLPGGRLRVAEAPNPARRSRSASPASSAGRASPSRSPPRRLDADAAGASHTTTTFARTGRTGPASAAAAAAAAATGVMRLGPVVGAATATAAAGAGRRAQLPARSPGRPRLAPVSTLVSAFISAARRGTGLQDATLPSFLPPSSAATGVAAPTGRAIGDLGLDRDPHNISRHASPLQSRSPSPSPSPSPRREASSPGLAGSPRRPMTMTTTAAAQTSPLRPHGYLALGSPPRSSPQRPLSTSPYASPRGRRATVSAQTSPQRSLGSLGLMRLASLPRGQAVLQSVQRTHASARPTSPIFPPGSTAAAIAAAAAPRTSYGAASGANRRTLEQVLSGLAALPATATPTAGFTALAAAAAARPAAPATTMAALTPAAGGGGGGRSLSPRLQAMQAETLSRLRVAGAPTVGLAGGLGRGYSSSAGAAPEAARGPGPSLAPLSAADLLPPHGAYGAPADRGSRRYSPPHRSHGGSGPGAARSGATPSFAAAGFATPKPVPGTAVATPNARATRDAAEARARRLPARGPLSGAEAEARAAGNAGTLSQGGRDGGLELRAFGSLLDRSGFAAGSGPGAGGSGASSEAGPAESRAGSTDRRDPSRPLSYGSRAMGSALAHPALALASSLGTHANARSGHATPSHGSGGGIDSGASEAGGGGGGGGSGRGSGSGAGGGTPPIADAVGAAVAPQAGSESEGGSSGPDWVREFLDGLAPLLRPGDGHRGEPWMQGQAKVAQSVASAAATATTAVAAASPSRTAADALAARGGASPPIAPVVLSAVMGQAGQGSSPAVPPSSPYISKASLGPDLRTELPRSPSSNMPSPRPPAPQPDSPHAASPSAASPGYPAAAPASGPSSPTASSRPCSASASRASHRSRPPSPAPQPPLAVPEAEDPTLDLNANLDLELGLELGLISMDSLLGLRRLQQPMQPHAEPSPDTVLQVQAGAHASVEPAASSPGGQHCNAGLEAPAPSAPAGGGTQGGAAPPQGPSRASTELRVLMHLAAAASSAHAETEKARVEAEARLAAQAMAGASAELHRREAEAQAGLSGLLGLALGADQQEHEEQQESSSPSLLLGMPWGAAPGRGPSAADGGGEAELGRPRRLLDSLAAADEEAASASATVPTMEHERVSFEAEGVGEALVGERNVPASPLSGLTAGTPGPQALSGQSGAEALDREGSEPHERPASPVPVQPRSQGAGSYGPQASPQNSLPVLTSPGVGAEAVRLGSPPACSPMHLPHPTTTAAATAPSSALPSRSAEDAECLPALSPPPTRGGPAFMSSAAASAPSASGLLAQAGASRYATFAESPESPVPYALPADAEAEEEGDCTEDPAALASAAPSARSPARSEGLAPGSVPRESSGGDSRSGGSSSGGGRGSRAEARLAPATAASVSSQPVGSEATECGRLTAAPGPLQQRSAIQGGHSGQALKPAAPGVRLPLQQQSDVAPQPQLQPMLQAPPAAGLAGGRPGAAAAAPAPAGVQGEAAGTALLRRAPPQPAGPQPIRHAAGVAAAGDWVHANAAPQPPNRQAAVVVQPSLPTVRSGEGVRASVVAAARLSSTLLPSGPDDTPAPLPAESPALLGRRGGPGLEPLHRQPAANPGGDGKEDRWHASASTSSLAHPYAYPATSYEEGHDRSRLAPASTVTGYRHTLRAPLEQQLQPQSHTLARGPALHGPRAHWPGAVQGVVLAPARLSQTLAQAGFRQPATQAQPQAHLQDGLGQAPLHPHHSVPGDRGQAMQPGSLGQGGQGQGQRQALAALMASLQALNGVTQSACARMLDEFGGQGRGA